jgi:hypothetical protein
MHNWRNGRRGPLQESRWRGTRHTGLGRRRERGSNAHNMTLWNPENGVTVSDDEEGEYDDMGVCSNCNHRGMTGTYCPGCEDTGFVHESVRVRRVWEGRVRTTTRNIKERMLSNIRRLVRVGKAGNELPEVGQVCLVLRGDERKDVGQECVVTKQSAARVHISFRDKNGRQATKLKHPASLILLEDGLHVTQDAHGCVWIRREDNAEKEIDP